MQYKILYFTPIKKSFYLLIYNAKITQLPSIKNSIVFYNCNISLNHPITNKNKSSIITLKSTVNFNNMSSSSSVYLTSIRSIILNFNNYKGVQNVYKSIIYKAKINVVWRPIKSVVVSYFLDGMVYSSFNNSICIILDTNEKKSSDGLIVQENSFIIAKTPLDKYDLYIKKSILYTPYFFPKDKSYIINNIIYFTNEPKNINTQNYNNSANIENNTIINLKLKGKSNYLYNNNYINSELETLDISKEVLRSIDIYHTTLTNYKLYNCKVNNSILNNCLIYQDTHLQNCKLNNKITISGENPENNFRKDLFNIIISFKGCILELKDTFFKNQTTPTSIPEQIPIEKIKNITFETSLNNSPSFSEKKLQNNFKINIIEKSSNIQNLSNVIDNSIINKIEHYLLDKIWITKELVIKGIESYKYSITCKNSYMNKTSHIYTDSNKIIMLNGNISLNFYEITCNINTSEVVSLENTTTKIEKFINSINLIFT